MNKSLKLGAKVSGTTKLVNGSAPKSMPKSGMDAEEFRKAAHAVIEDSEYAPYDHACRRAKFLAVIEYNQSLPDLPVLSKVQPGYLAPQLPKCAPSQPQSWQSIQNDVSEFIKPGLTHWQSPNFMAFFPACSTYPSILGEMYSAAFTAPAFNWLCSPACTELETIVLDWLAQMLALPKEFMSTEGTGGGVIHGSASEAIVTVMVAARERYLYQRVSAEGLKEGTSEWDERTASLRGRLVALSSDQAHSSTQKAARIAGTRYRSIKTDLDEDLALTGVKLEEALQECEKQGLEPYYLTTSLGTTSTCAVDNFAEIHKIKEKYLNLWVHVDAAYAGAALICPEYQHYSATLRVADSFNMNMHKWLLVNFDASCLFVQKRGDLTSALTITPSYLQNKHTDSGLVTDYRDWQIPLGRRFRALKIWFVMRKYGVDGMQAHIRKTVGIGETLCNLVQQRQDIFEIIATPRFALTCFRVRASFVLSRTARNGEVESATAATGAQIGAANGVFTPSIEGEAEAEANNVTKRVADLMNERGEIFLTSSVVAGKCIIRVVSANQNAEEQNIRDAFEIILKTTKEVLSSK